MHDINITTDRLILKSPIGLIDEIMLCEQLNDADTSKYLSSIPYPFTTGDASSLLEHIENSTNSINLGIFLKENDAFIGMISLENIDTYNHKAEIGYWLGFNYINFGYGKEACRPIIDYAFEVLNLNKIVAYVIRGNAAANKIFAQLNFIVEGLLVQDILNKGQLVDRYVLANFKN